MITNETVALQRVLLESLWREIRTARDRATKARQEATHVEERLNLLLRQLVHAGAAPSGWKDGSL